MTVDDETLGKTRRPSLRLARGPDLVDARPHLAAAPVPSAPIATIANSAVSMTTAPSG